MGLSWLCFLAVVVVVVANGQQRLHQQIPAMPMCAVFLTVNAQVLIILKDYLQKMMMNTMQKS